MQHDHNVNTSSRKNVCLICCARRQLKTCTKKRWSDSKGDHKHHYQSLADVSQRLETVWFETLCDLLIVSSISSSSQKVCLDRGHSGTAACQPACQWCYCLPQPQWKMIQWDSHFNCSTAPTYQLQTHTSTSVHFRFANDAYQCCFCSSNNNYITFHTLAHYRRWH